MKPNDDVLTKSISETVTNGKKLLEDAKTLFDWDRFSSDVVGEPALESTY